MKYLLIARLALTADETMQIAPDPRPLPRLSLIVIRAIFPEKLAQFYTVLGLHFEIEQHGNGPPHYVSQDRELVFEIYPRRDDDPGTAALRLGFEIEMFDFMLKALIVQGGTIQSTASRNHLRRSTILRDPEGHVVELYEAATSVEKTI